MHDDLFLRHRNERFGIKAIALGRALLPQIELRSLRKGEPGFALTGANAHRLARIERIGPGGQFPLARIHINAKLGARQLRHEMRIISVRRTGKTLHAKRMHAALCLHGHRRYINQVSDMPFLRHARTGKQESRAQRSPQFYTILHHISSAQSRLLTIRQPGHFPLLHIDSF